MIANDALIESWQLSLHAKRPRTVVVYLREIRAFEAWLASHGNPDLAAVTKQDIRLWIAWGQGRGLKPATIRSRFFCVQAFYGWAVREDELEVNPCTGIEMARDDSPPPAVLSADQTARLLKACEGPRFKDRRDLALFRLMLATGLRAGETTALALSDLDLVGRVVAVREGKGGKPRVGRFDPATAAALDRYRRVRARHRHTSLPKLWIGERGAFTPKGLALALDTRAAAAGIGHVHPHQLRHTFADRWLDAGGEEGALQILGGWEDAKTMARYGSARAVDRAMDRYDEIDPMRGV